MTFPHYFENEEMFVPLTSWIELKKRNESNFTDMVEAAKKVIASGRAFVIYSESDTSIIYRCDRLSELDSAIADSYYDNPSLG